MSPCRLDYIFMHICIPPVSTRLCVLPFGIVVTRSYLYRLRSVLSRVRVSPN
nr:MAG TPA: hypothetical protein [Caudoviricetes sp.]